MEGLFYERKRARAYRRMHTDARANSTRGMSMHGAVVRHWDGTQRGLANPRYVHGAVVSTGLVHTEA